MAVTIPNVFSANTLIKSADVNADFSALGAALPWTANPIAAKGDLISGTAASTSGITSIGTDGKVLTADATQTTGMKWATPAASPSSSLKLVNLGLNATSPTETITGDTSNGSSTVSNVSSIIGLVVGQLVTGTGISASTIITAIGSTTITLSAGATATNSGVTLTCDSLILIKMTQDDGTTDPALATPTLLPMRSATATDGSYISRSVTSALQIGIYSGATLGLAAASSQNVYIYAIDHAGTIELAVSGNLYDDSSVVTTLAMATSADLSMPIYSDTARTGVAIKLIGRLKAPQTVAGVWSTAPSELALATTSFPKDIVAFRAMSDTPACTFTGGSDAVTFPSLGTYGFDTHKKYNSSTGVYSIPKTGIYRVTVYLAVQGNWTSSYVTDTQISVNSTIIAACRGVGWATNTGAPITPACTALLSLTEGDAVQPFVFSNVPASAFSGADTKNYFEVSLL